MGYMRHHRNQNKHTSKTCLLSLRICLFKDNQALKFQILKEEMVRMTEERVHTSSVVSLGSHFFSSLHTPLPTHLLLLLYEMVCLNFVFMKSMHTTMFLTVCLDADMCIWVRTPHRGQRHKISLQLELPDLGAGNTLSVTAKPSL